MILRSFMTKARKRKQEKARNREFKRKQEIGQVSTIMITSVVYMSADYMLYLISVNYCCEIFEVNLH